MHITILHHIVLAYPWYLIQSQYRCTSSKLFDTLLLNQKLIAGFKLVNYPSTAYMYVYVCYHLPLLKILFSDGETDQSLNFICVYTAWNSITLWNTVVLLIMGELWWLQIASSKLWHLTAIMMAILWSTGFACTNMQFQINAEDRGIFVLFMLLSFQALKVVFTVWVLVECCPCGQRSWRGDVVHISVEKFGIPLIGFSHVFLYTNPCILKRW